MYSMTFLLVYKENFVGFVDILYIYTKGHGSPEEDIQHCAQTLLNFGDNSDSKKPKVLWSAYYSAPDTSKTNLYKDLPNNVFLCPGPDLDLDYDFTIKQVLQPLTLF